MTQTQTQIPPALQQVLISMGAQPTAPGPMGQPIKSVVGSMMSAGAGAGMGVGEGTQQAAQQAGIASQIQAMREKELMERMRHMASRGIADGVDVPMAEGGIVGYSGEGPSYVRSPEEQSETAIKRLTFKDILNWLRGKGTVYDPEASPPEPPARLTPQEAERQVKPVGTSYSSGIDEALAAGRQRPSRQPAAPTPTQRPAVNTAATATPASTGMIDYAKALQDMMGVQEKGFKALEDLAKPQPQTPEELAFVKRQEDEVARRRAGLESRKQEYLDSERAREKAGEVSKLQGIARFLTNTGGAGSLFQGLGRATQIQGGIDDARRKEAQAAIDRRRQYFDLLEQQRDAIEDRDIAIRQGQMDRAKAAQDRVQELTRGIAALRIQTSAQMYGPTLQAGQQVQSVRDQIASREKIARGRDAAIRAAALAKGVKPPPGMGIGDVQKLNEMVSNEFRTLGNDARRIIGRMPNGVQLLRDIDNKNIDLKSESGRAKVAPIMAQAMNVYKQELLGQTKFGAQPMSYGAATSMLGLSPDEDED
jgi:hypothetical protein